MAHTGILNWSALQKSTNWVNTGLGSTYVYAFWLADVPEHPTRDSGLAMLRNTGMHPDWFCAAPRTDTVLFPELRPTDVVSPNLTEVFTDGLHARPVLGALCLGAASATYASAAENIYWWAHDNDMTRPGIKIIKDVSDLYARRPVILTFLDFAPIGQVTPGASGLGHRQETPGH